jgi:hypothetical protein
MKQAVTLMCALAMLLAAHSVALAQSTAGCAEAAHVSWETNWNDVTVTGAVVEVRGCEDGTPVGLQLITDDGDVPAEALVSEVTDEQAHFDLEPLGLRIEPVIGVRVFIYGDPVAEFVTIIVEQRLFATSGNEQRGLRQATVLDVPLGGRYLVPGAPTRYEVVACAAMNTTLPGDLVAQGAGTFTATEPGTHVVCYQQQPGTPGGAPDLETPRVLDDTEVLEGAFEADPPASADDSLATTGLNVLAVGLFTLVLLIVGRRLTRIGH